MYFEQFNDIITAQKDRLLRRCKDAEKLIFVRPNYAIFMARQALECLCGSLLSDEGKKYNSNLCDTIELCRSSNLFTKEISDTAHKLRIKANDVVHNGEFDGSIDNMGTNYAYKVVRDLYSIMKRTFKKKDSILPFNPVSLPIGEYCIVRTVEKSLFELRNANVTDKERKRDVESYNYIAKRNESEYVYIKSYNKNDKNNPFYNRTESVIDIINRSRIRDTYAPRISRIDTDSNCERSYAAYPIYEDSEVLFEHEGEFSLRQSIAITLDIICTIEAMYRMQLSYRNVNPYRVVITPYENSYQAILVNMESVRNENDPATIYNAVRKFYKENVFIHPAVRNIPAEEYDGNSIPWDKAAAYSCMVLFAYCAVPESINAMNIDMQEIDSLLREYPELDELCISDYIYDTFQNSFQDIPALSEMRKVFEYALDILEE